MTPGGNPRIRAPGGIVLVSCYELGHPPHAIASLAARLTSAGFAPRCVDLQVQHLTRAEVSAAQLAVISVPMHTALRMGAQLARDIAELSPECHVCMLGLYAPLNREHLEQVGVNSLLGGEAEDDVVSLAQRIAERGVAEPGAASVVERRGSVLPRRSELPPLSSYSHFIAADGSHRVAGYTETTRGCLDTCRHCPVPAVYGGRFFAVPRDIVLADIEQQVDAGAQHITFGDPDFLNGPGHGLEIARRVHQRWPELSFDITAQVSHLLRHEARLPELADSGCAFVVTAAESLSDRVLERLGKRHRRRDLERALDTCGNAGLAVRPTFVPFTPWTTLEDMVELIDFVAARGLTDAVDPVQLSIRLLVPPGSLLLEAADTRDAFGDLDAASFTHAWRAPDPRLDALQLELAALAEPSSGAPGEVFEAMRAAIYAAAGRAAPPLPLPPARPTPRLSEPWFC